MTPQPPNPQSTDTQDELRVKLQTYNWSSDKDYQLAVIAFRELFNSQALKLLDRLRDNMPTYIDHSCTDDFCEECITSKAISQYLHEVLSALQEERQRYE